MNDYRAFIEAKCRFYAEHCVEKVNRQVWLHIFAPRNEGRLSKTAARRLESSMERFMADRDPALLSRMRQELRANFGFDRIGVAPDVVIQKVLARGRIRGDREA